MKFIIAGITLFVLFNSSVYAQSQSVFDPYAFKEIGSCADSANLQFNYLITRGFKALGKDAQGRTIIFSSQVAFNLKGQFRAVSEEYVWNGDTRVVLKKDTVSGTAKLNELSNGAQMDLYKPDGKFWAGMVFTDLEVNDWGKMINLVFPDRTDAQGDVLWLGLFQGTSKVGPYLESTDDYCKSPF